MNLVAAKTDECYRSAHMPSVSDDPWQLKMALSGEEAAWKRLVDEFSLPIWQWARSYDLTREEAEDVAQTVWCKLKDKGETIHEPARLPGWLATTTKREALSVIRGRSRTIGVADDFFYDLGDSEPNVADLAEVGEMNARILEAYQSLNEGCRTLLALCWTGNLSYEEIAEILGRSVGYIGPTRQRCLNSLRARAGLT